MHGKDNLNRSDVASTALETRNSLYCFMNHAKKLLIVEIDKRQNSLVIKHKGSLYFYESCGGM